MENKNIIIILVAIIVILAAALGVMFLQTANAKEPTRLMITNDQTLKEGDSLSIKLTDLNKTPLSKEKVNILITNSKGKLVVNKTVRTNSYGNAKVDVDLKKGDYTFEAVYRGNENYTGNDTKQNLTIEEKVVEAQLISSSSKSSSSTPYDINNLPPTNDPYPETNRYYIDEYHVKQEYADGYMRTVDVRTGEIHSLGFR